MDGVVRDLAVPVGVLVGDRFADGNAALSRFCGRELTGSDWTDLFAPQDHAVLQASIGAVLAGQTRRHDVQCIRASGTVAVSVSLSPTMYAGVGGVAIAIEDMSLRVVLGERLIESENRLQRLISSVGNAIVAADTRGRIVLWNDAATRMFGHAELDALGEQFAMLFPPELANEYTREHFGTDALASLGRTTFSLGLRKDGSQFPTQMSFASSDFGGACWFTAVIHDDSERQDLIASLARSEASFRALVEQSPDPLFVHGGGLDDYEVLYANASMLELLGFSAADLVRRPSIETFVHADDRVKLAEYRARRARGDVVSSLDLRWVRRDGTILDIQTISREVRYQDQPAILVFARDVTDRLRQEADRARAEAIVRQSEERYRIMFDANPFPCWMLDPTTMRFVAVNDAMVRTYGYTREELLQMTVLDLKVSDDESVLRGSIAKGVGVKRHRRKDGSLVDVDITVHPIPLAGGTTVLGIGKDVTNELRLEEQLRQTQKMEAIGQLAGGIAHDFNNILAVIIANTELALEDLGNHPAVSELEEVAAAATRATDLTRQLLAFSRKERREIKRLALNVIVTKVEKMLSRIVGEDVALSALLASRLGTFEGDAGQVEQILMNLVVNARDAMPGGGRILIETANAQVDDAEAAALGIAAGRYVTLSVTDTGCGMDDHVRARIFEPFFTTKEVGKGTGLGLSTVFGIVNQSGGGIAVESRIGQGTTFRIYLPRVFEEQPDVAQKQERFVAATSSGTVLLVEDDAQLRVVLRRYLARWGYTLLEATNGRVALEVVRDHDGPIDLLLTDLVMPEMDGRTLARQVVAMRPATSVVFMSGYTEHPALHNAALERNEHFMQKPFTARLLSEVVSRAFTEARSR